MNNLQMYPSRGNNKKNIRSKMDLQKKRLKKELTRSMLHKFYLHSALYAIVIIVLFGVGYYICSQKIWYKSTPFYFLIHWLHYEWFECFLVIFVAGLLLLAFWYFRKFIWILEYILDEVEQMAQESTGTSSNLSSASQSANGVGHNNDFVPGITLNYSGNRSNPPRELQEIQLQMELIREQMEKSRRTAKEAEQRKNDLIVYMAHDLKTPLTSVIGYLNLLYDEKEISPELQEKYLGIALRKSERLEELINEFFEITRLQLASMILQKSQVNLERMLEQIAYEFRPQLQEKNVNYELHLESSLELNCDIDKMERVFDNLMKNALHYSYANSTIHISAYREMAVQNVIAVPGEISNQKDFSNSQIVIQVDNQGKTIPPEKLEQIFEQFFRMDSSRASYSGGAGLGLAIAKEIVEAHGGTISCTSEQEHICFRIILPS